MLLAALIAVPLGLLIGLPALRLRGVNLAVVTLAAAFAIDALVFNDEGFSGGLRRPRHPVADALRARPRDREGQRLPARHLRRLRAGRRLPRRAAGRPAAQRAGGAHVHRRALQRARRGRGRASTSRARSCWRSALSAFIAGLGGCLFAYDQQTVTGAVVRGVHLAEPAGDHLRRRRRADRRRGRGRRDAVEHRPAGHRARQVVQHRQVPARRGRRAAHADRDQAARRDRRRARRRRS